MNNKTTMVLITHNRPQYLKRALVYYANMPCKILIADSSDEKYPFNLPENTEYHFLPGIGLVSKLAYIADLVDTKYVFLSSDDDFWVKEAVVPCVDFLEHNQDYSAAGGRIISFSENSTCFAWWPFFPHVNNLDVNSNLIDERLTMIMSNYMPFFYSMYRSSVFRRMFKDNSNTGVRHEILNEYSVILYSLIYGKYKTLPIFSFAYNFSSFPAPAKRDFLCQIKNSDDQQQYIQFKLNLSNEIKKIDSNLDGEEIISRASSLDETRRLPENDRKISYLLKQSLKRVIFLKLCVKICKNYCKMMAYHSILYYKIKNFKGYPNTDREAKKSWLEIKKVISEHRVSRSIRSLRSISQNPSCSI